MKTLSILVVTLILAFYPACSAVDFLGLDTDPAVTAQSNPDGSETENPGENPGGDNPGSNDPGGENPGGENPGGEDPGDPGSSGVCALDLEKLSARVPGFVDSLNAEQGIKTVDFASGMPDFNPDAAAKYWYCVDPRTQGFVYMFGYGYESLDYVLGGRILKSSPYDPTLPAANLVAKTLELAKNTRWIENGFVQCEDTTLRFGRTGYPLYASSQCSTDESSGNRTCTACANEGYPGLIKPFAMSSQQVNCTTRVCSAEGMGTTTGGLERVSQQCSASTPERQDLAQIAITVVQFTEGSAGTVSDDSFDGIITYLSGPQEIHCTRGR